MFGRAKTDVGEVTVLRLVQTAHDMMYEGTTELMVVMMGNQHQPTHSQQNHYHSSIATPVLCWVIHWQRSSHCRTVASLTHSLAMWHILILFLLLLLFCPLAQSRRL